MRSTLSLDAVGFVWNTDALPPLPDSPDYRAPEDDEAQQREFVEEIYRDLGVGD